MNRKDHIALDQAMKYLTSDSVIIAQGEDEYMKGIKIIFKLLGVSTRKGSDKEERDPFEQMKKSMGKILGVG